MFISRNELYQIEFIFDQVLIKRKKSQLPDVELPFFVLSKQKCPNLLNFFLSMQLTGWEKGAHTLPLRCFSLMTRDKIYRFTYHNMAPPCSLLVRDQESAHLLLGRSDCAVHFSGLWFQTRRHSLPSVFLSLAVVSHKTVSSMVTSSNIHLKHTHSLRVSIEFCILLFFVLCYFSSFFPDLAM